MSTIAFISGSRDLWLAFVGQVGASDVIPLSVRQDIELRARVGAAFGFLMAMAFGFSAMHTAIRADLRYTAAICGAILFCEVCLVVRWWIRKARQ